MVRKKEEFVVIHPLDDVLERKVDLSGLGPMRLTRSAKAALLALRGYLILMLMLVVYHMLGVAGILGR